jgi:hypothetical protein
MKLPSHVLTKLCLVGAVGTVGVAIGCERASRIEAKEVIDERPEPVIVDEETAPMEPVRMVPSYAQPAAAPQFAPPPPPQPQAKKVRPKPQATPIRLHGCGPCGMG